jgi:hypothetical protein
MYSRSQTDARDSRPSSRADTIRSGTSRSGTSRAGSSRAPSSIRTNTTARRDSNASTVRPQSIKKQRPRRVRAFPPVAFSDLTRSDLALVAPILVPQRLEQPRKVYEKGIKTLIAALPAHLHAKHPMLSPFCRMHSKINPMPISSLFFAIREEIEDHLPRVWGPLARRKQLSAQKEEMVEIVTHLAVLWMGEKTFKARFERDPRMALVSLKTNKCNACKLVLIGKDFPTLVAMAGLFIGRVKKSVWGKSKRIQFLLEWTASRLPPRLRAEGAALVWELGRKFRITRIGAMASQRRRGKRARVEDGDEDDGAGGKVEDEDEGDYGPGTASYAFSLDRELREERSRGPRKLIGSSAFAEADGQRENYERLLGNSRLLRNETEYDLEQQHHEHQQQHEQEQQQQHQQGSQKRPASSMYSRDTSGEHGLPPSIAIHHEVDAIINIYQSGATQDHAQDYSTSAAQQEYPQLNPYARDEDSDEDLGPEMAYEPITDRSRIQSTIDRAAGGHYDGKSWKFF